MLAGSGWMVVSNPTTDGAWPFPAVEALKIACTSEVRSARP